MMQRVGRAIGALLATSLVLVACTPSSDDGPEAARTLDPVPSISNPLGECARDTAIGAALSLDEGDLQALQGAQLAAEQLTSRGSFNYSVSEPEGSSDEATLAAVESGAVAVVGPTQSDEVFEVVDAAASSSVTVLSLANNSDVSSDGLFDLAMDDFRTLAQTFVFMSSVEKAKSVALVFDGSEGVEARRAEVTKALKDSGLKIVEEAVFEDEASEALRRASDAQPDFIFVSPGAGEEAAFLQVAGALDLSAPLVGGPSFHDPQVIAGAGDAAEGLIVGTAWDAVSRDRINERFVASFEQKFGAEPSVEAARGYTAVILVAGAVEEACSNDPNDVRAGIAAAEGASSPLGRLSFTRSRDAIHPAVVLTVTDGAFELR